MIRPRLVSLGIGLVLGVLLAAGGASGSASSSSVNGGNLIRWDLSQIVQGTVLCCGTNVAKDATTGDTLTLTGSGEARTNRHGGSAAGGGTFVHERPHGHGAEVVAQGIYVVTGFVSLTDGAGTLPIPDGIGRASDARAGLLTLDVQFQPDGGTPVAGELTIQCVLPGNTLPPGTEEGIVVEVGPFEFEPAGGVTLFHILA